MVFATRGIMKEWGEILKRKSVSLHTQVSWTTGLRNNFLTEAETLRCLKLKWMWDGIFCNDPEDSWDSEKEGKQGTKTNPEALEEDR